MTNWQGEERRKRSILTQDEARMIATELAQQMPQHEHACHIFTEAEVQTVKGFINTKKRAVKMTLWIMGALIVWALQDFFEWVITHLRWGGQ